MSVRVILKSLFWIFIILKLAGECAGSIDVVFLIDGSTHTNPHLFKHELMMIPHLIRALPRSRYNFRFGLVTYSDRPELQIGIGRLSNRQALIDNLWKVKQPHSDHTGLCFALKMTRELLFNDKFRPYYDSALQGFIVIFSNGIWDLPRLTKFEASKLRNMGIKILLVSVGQMNAFLAHQVTHRIIHQPYNVINYYDNRKITNFIINNIYNNIEIEVDDDRDETTTVKSTSTTPLISTILTTPQSTTISTPTTPATPTTVSDMTMITSASPVVTGPPITLICNISGELVIIIDSSNGVQNQLNYQILLNTTQYILQRLPTTQEWLSTAIVTFGNGEAVLNYNYEKFKTITNIEKSITSLKFLGGSTNAGDGLNLANQKIFMNQLVPDRNRRVVIFMTKVSETGPDPVVVNRVMKTSNGISVLPIGIQGGSSLTWVLSQMGSPDLLSVYIDDFNKLIQYQDRIVNRICDM